MTRAHLLRLTGDDSEPVCQRLTQMADLYSFAAEIERIKSKR